MGPTAAVARADAAADLAAVGGVFGWSAAGSVRSSAAGFTRPPSAAAGAWLSAGLAFASEAGLAADFATDALGLDAEASESVAADGLAADCALLLACALTAAACADGFVPPGAACALVAGRFAPSAGFDSSPVAAPSTARAAAGFCGALALTALFLAAGSCAAAFLAAAVPAVDLGAESVAAAAVDGGWGCAWA
jgi:hypothetical protein